MRELPTSNQILKVLHQHPGKTFRLRELVVELGLRSSQARELKRALKELSRHGKIVDLKNNHFALVSQAHREARTTGTNRAEVLRRTHGRAGEEPPRRHIVAGRLIGHRDGYGFVVPDQPLPQTDLDIYIPRGRMGSAMHGDRVEVQVLRSKEGGRLEGSVARVTERAQKSVVGEFRSGPRGSYVQPLDHRIPMEILIPHGQEWPSESQESRGRNRQYGGESEGERQDPRPQVASRRSPRELERMIVDVQLTSYADPHRGIPPRGRVVEILGRREDFGIDVEIMIRKFHLPHRFPLDVLAEAESTAQYVSEADREGRRDFRALPIVTIDGETAKDFDDAVHVERLADGNFRLQVHIADVAHYVRPGMALDREARLRGTSVYFPDRAVPMLPLELSNGICSLNPQVDRLTMSALMEMDSQGRIVEYELVPGIIHSAERMTYTTVRDILAGDRAACRHYAPLVENFKLMERLALILSQNRERRGSIDFDLPEPAIEFDEQGRMIGITRSERNIAHRIIEEFMLAANEAVAGYLERRGVPSLHRVHEKPDPKKVLEFEEIAATFGYSLGIALPSSGRFRIRGRDERERHPRSYEHAEAIQLEISPRHYQRLTQRIEGKPEERILSYLMLRSLKQARYAEESLGHFALATDTYTHFTSPIRRYPDLIVHRILKAALTSEGGSALVRTGLAPAPDRRAVGVGVVTAQDRRGVKAALVPARNRHQPVTARSDSRAEAPPRGGAFVSPAELQALAVETSEAERRAQDAERELIEWKKASFMAERLGDEFEALIISLTKHGFFVELTDLFVEGFVPLASLDDDRYIYRERLRAIVGQHSKKAYRLGERVTVRLDRIEREGNKLEFSVA